MFVAAASSISLAPPGARFAVSLALAFDQHRDRRDHDAHDDRRLYHRARPTRLPI